MEKIELHLKFNQKRNYKLTTPCCRKTNKDGKFVNFMEYGDFYGYCHSCGKSTLPPPLYRDEIGNEYTWDTINNEFKPIVLQLSHKNVLQCNTNNVIQPIKSKYLPKNLLLEYYNNTPENNLMYYIRIKYGDIKAERAKKMYYIGTYSDGGTVFWNINKGDKIQKAKISYYNKQGKRTNKFLVPFKNEAGYYSCLFGEHLIGKSKNINKPIILVESEKTAVICSILLPQYIWISYGGLNGFTDTKMKALIGHKVLLVPDMSENAVAIMTKKLPTLIKLGIDAHLWDMTNRKSDEELKDKNLYNCDLEDIFRSIV